MSLADLNAKLRGQSYVDGGVAPTQADAKEFAEIFGNNENVIAWVARMASYYAVERKQLAAQQPKKEEKGDKKKDGKADKKKEDKPKAEKKEDKPKAEKKKEDKPKKEAPKKEEKKEEKKDAPAPAAGELTEKKKKALIKEGGKKAQDLAGMADMGSLFQQAMLNEPEGRLEWLTMTFDAMNVEVDPEAEERKGGASGVAKILLSATDDRFACIVHVPEMFTDPKHPDNTRGYEVSAIDWFNAAFATLPGDGQGYTVHEQSKTVVKATYTPDPEKGRYTLKAKDAVSGSSFGFLRSRSLVVDDDDDSEEMVFGDDDMPGC